MAQHELGECDEMILKLVRELPLDLVLSAFTPEQRLAGLSLEQRLAGLSLEQRLAILPREQAVLAASDEVLRGLSDEYLASLSAETRAVIRRRIGR